MKNAKFIAAAATAALLFGASSSFAQSSNGVRISGSLSNTTNVAGQVTQAVRGGTASTSIGTVHGGANISGRVFNRTTVRSQRTLASGRRSTACTSVGSIGNDKNCD